MNPSRIFILRPIATTLLMIAIVLSGIIAYQLLPVSSLPQVDYPTIQVSTGYPGASPDVVASHITAPLEKQFGQMPGLNQMTSSSSDGLSLITLQFNLNLSLDIAEQEVQAAINTSGSYLPENLPTPPIYKKINPADTPIVTLALLSKTTPLTDIQDVADTRLAPKIAELPGVGAVTINGGQKPAIRIQVNSRALAANQLSLENIRSAISTATVNAAKGNFDGPQLSQSINANDQLLTPDDYRALIIAYRNNAVLRLGDVATVINGAENTEQMAWNNTSPAIIMNVLRQPGANVISVVDEIKQLLPMLKTSLPGTVALEVVADRTITIRASIHDVEFELMLAIGLVVMIIFLFLRNLPATFIPSITVPVALIGTFSVMYFLGFSINNLTLMALTISTGFVVDDAIVMIENISRYLEEGLSPLEAALKGSRQIAFTIISLTVSLIAVLIPLLFMSDVIGRLFREFAMTVSITILISGFVSLTLTPMLCARLLRHRSLDQISSFESRSQYYFEKLLTGYQHSLQWTLKNQSLILKIMLATLLITGFLFYRIPKDFFPIEDTGLVQGITVAAPNISFDQMAKDQKAITDSLLKDPAVENITSFIGIDGTNVTLNTGRLQITLKPLNERSKNISEILNRMQNHLAKIPGVSLYLQPTSDITLDNHISRTAYQYSLTSPDAQTLALWTNTLNTALKKEKNLSDVTLENNNNAQQTHIDFDRNTAGRLGITTQMLDDTLYDAFGQRQVATLFTQKNQYHVILETLPEIQFSPNTLNNIYLLSSTNQPVPFDTITHISETLGPLVVQRESQFPVNLISFNLAKNVGLSDAITSIDRTVQSLHIPLSIEAHFEGAASIFKNALNNEVWLLLAAVLSVYIILGILYESYIHPITIISTLPSATMGALLSLYFMHDSLNIIALIGIVLLIGIVMKNAIMMIDFALTSERENNKNPSDAIYEACLLRFRPILMTTLAALFSAVPLALSHGMGSELRQPLGIVIIGGLIVSQLLTLYTTPVIYLFLDKLKKSSRFHNASENK